MIRKRILNPPPRPEVIRIRYRTFFVKQARILKNSRRACRREIRLLSAGHPGSS